MRSIRTRLWIPVFVVLWVANIPLGSFAKEVITIWTGGGSGTYYRMVESLLPELEKAFPDVEIDLVHDDRSRDRLLVALASGTAPDIVTQSTRNAPMFIEFGGLLPVDFEAIGVHDQQGFEQQYFPGSLGTLLINGEAYFLPTEMTTFATFLNRDLLNAAGVVDVPGTWEEIREMGKRLNQFGGDGSFTREGLVVERGDVWDTFHLVSMLRQQGMDWLTEEGRQGFLDDRSVRAMDVYTSLFLDRAANPSSTWTSFRDGNGAIYPGPAFQHRHFTMAERATFFDVDVMPYPHLEGENPVSPSYAWGFFVTNQSRNPQLAWQIAHFLTGPQFAEQWFRQASYLIPHRGQWLDELYRTTPSWKEFLDALNHAQVELSHPEFADISRAIGEAERRIVGMEMGVRPSVEILHQQIEAILNRESTP